MAKQVTIPIVGEPLLTSEGVITEVILREPTFDDYLDLGDIVTVARMPDGALFPIENSETLRLYIQKCLVQPKSALQLGAGGARLARAVKGAVLSFFQDDPSAGAPSTTSPTTSSSDAATDASPQTPSVG